MTITLITNLLLLSLLLEPDSDFRLRSLPLSRFLPFSSVSESDPGFALQRSICGYIKKDAQHNLKYSMLTLFQLKDIKSSLNVCTRCNRKNGYFGLRATNVLLLFVIQHTNVFHFSASPNKS